MALDSTGRAHWEGDLFTGHGTASVDSGAFDPVQVDWKARAEDQGGKTNPEELIAAAHATCYSMAFSNILAKNETPPTSLDVSATITFVPGTGITTSRLTVTGVVPGIDERSEEHTSELQSRPHLVCRLLLEKKKHNQTSSP